MSSVAVCEHPYFTLFTRLTDIEFEFDELAQTQLAKAVTPDATLQVLVISFTAFLKASEAQGARLVM